MKFELLLFFLLGGGGGPLGEILKYAGNCPKILMILEFGANFFLKKIEIVLRSPKMLKLNGVGVLTLNLKKWGNGPPFYQNLLQVISVHRHRSWLNHTQKLI